MCAELTIAAVAMPALWRLPLTQWQGTLEGEPQAGGSRRSAGGSHSYPTESMLCEAQGVSARAASHSLQAFCDSVPPEAFPDTWSGAPCRCRSPLRSAGWLPPGRAHNRNLSAAPWGRFLGLGEVDERGRGPRVATVGASSASASPPRRRARCAPSRQSTTPTSATTRGMRRSGTSSSSSDCTTPTPRWEPLWMPALL